MSIKAILVSAGVVVAAMALPAAAAQITLEYVGAAPGVGNTKQVRITAAPVDYPSGVWPKDVGAFGFNMTDTGGTLGSFLAWCLDLSHFLNTTGAPEYVVTDTPFSNSFGIDGAQKGRLQSVFSANFGKVDATDGNQSAGFQLALWNALYDGDLNVGTGTFAATADADIITLANGYLGAANTYGGGQRWKMTFLESKTGNQNLVTVSPVPLPAAGLLLLAALAGMGLAGRRRAV